MNQNQSYTSREPRNMIHSVILSFNETRGLWACYCHGSPCPGAPLASLLVGRPSTDHGSVHPLAPPNTQSQNLRYLNASPFKSNTLTSSSHHASNPSLPPPRHIIDTRPPSGPQCPDKTPGLHPVGTRVQHPMLQRAESHRHHPQPMRGHLRHHQVAGNRTAVQSLHHLPEWQACASVAHCWSSGLRIGRDLTE